MYCSKCGAFNDKNAKFCTSCGSSILDNNQQNNTSTENDNNDQLVNQTQSEPVMENNVQPVNETQNESVIDNNVNVQPVAQPQSSPTPNTNKPKQTSVGMIIGIVSLVLSFLFNVLIVPVAIVGLIISIVEKNKKGKVAGIVLNIVAIVLPILFAVLVFVGFSSIFKEINTYESDKTFVGDGYELTYNMSWTEETYSGKDVLAYSYADDSYFFPLGRSNLTAYSCDFSESTCKNKMYDDFYDLWGKELKEDSLNLYKESYYLLTLTDGIYYGTYRYGKSSTDLLGHYYIIISEEDNVVLSFFTRAEDSTTADLMETEVLSLLETIEITESEEDLKADDDENVIYDDELADTLDSMRDWNRYSSLRAGKLGKKADINGGWRILSDSETYWEFKNNTFYWYKSVNDLDDNYWYGTTKVYTGKEGFREIGLDENRIDAIVSRSKGELTADDFYTVICTPTKIISDGVDKSATNIPSGTEWKYVWIMVDHGKEGIEGQVLNVNNSSTSYYVKIKD